LARCRPCPEALASPLARYINPEPYTGQGGAVEQPAFDPKKPHPIYPPGAYERVLATPEEVIAERIGDENPPAR